MVDWEEIFWDPGSLERDFFGNLAVWKGIFWEPGRLGRAFLGPQEFMKSLSRRFFWESRAPGRM